MNETNFTEFNGIYALKSLKKARFSKKSGKYGLKNM